MINKKALLITQDFPPAIGGIQTYLDQLTRNLILLGFEVTVICPGSLKDLTNHHGAKVVRIPIHPSWTFLPLIIFLPIHLLRNKYSNILYGQWQNGICQLLFPFLFKKIDVTCFVHGRELFTSVLGYFARFIRPAVYKKVSRTIFHSHNIKKLFFTTGHHSTETHVIHPGVDPNIFYPENSEPLRKKLKINNGKIIYCITRWVRRKNLHHVIKAFDKLAESDPSLQLIIAGTGPEKPHLEELKASSPFQSRITFPGKIPDADLRSFYNLADIFILPSVEMGNDIEGFGIVFLEAGACEKAVISTRSGGIPDAVIHNETGILVPTGNTTELVQAISELLEDPEKCREMGLKSRKRIIKDLTWVHTAKNIANVLA